MVKKLLFPLFSVLSLHLAAQTTHNITWGFGSNPGAAGNANTARTISQGDTVVWNWIGDGSHNVVSITGGAETFSSGGTVNSTTNTFSYTFNIIGTTNFRCAPHASMNGSITVQTLSIPKFKAPSEFTIFPNPSSNFMTISLPSLIEDGLILQVFDVLGKQVYSQQLSALVSRVNIAKWKSGLYLVRLNSSDQNITLTKRFVKL